MNSGNSSGPSATDYWLVALLDLLQAVSSYVGNQEEIVDLDDTVLGLEGNPVNTESLGFVEDIEPDPSGLLGAFVLFIDDGDCE